MDMEMDFDLSRLTSDRYIPLVTYAGDSIVRTLFAKADKTLTSGNDVYEFLGADKKTEVISLRNDEHPYGDPIFSDWQGCSIKLNVLSQNKVAGRTKPIPSDRDVTPFAPELSPGNTPYVSEVLLLKALEQISQDKNAIWHYCADQSILNKIVELSVETNLIKVLGNKYRGLAKDIATDYFKDNTFGKKYEENFILNNNAMNEIVSKINPYLAYNRYLMYLMSSFGVSGDEILECFQKAEYRRLSAPESETVIADSLAEHGQIIENLNMNVDVFKGVKSISLRYTDDNRINVFSRIFKKDSKENLELEF